MRTIVAGLVLSVSLLLPRSGTAQVSDFRTPPPQVTAATAEWQINDEPIVYAGQTYLPTGSRVFFNPLLMEEVGEFRGVPLYVDPTLEPYSIVYVPVGGYRMRQYERPRTGAQAGTVGSRTPSFPVQMPPTQLPPEQPAAATGPVDVAGRAVFAYPVEENRPPPPLPKPTGLAWTSSRPSDQGIWIQFRRRRWYVAGDAIAFEPSRFAAIGTYRDFPVYRVVGGPPDRIFVLSVPGGALTQYARR